MVKAIISINEETNRILNIIKAKNGLKTKSQAIESLAQEYSKLLENMEISHSPPQPKKDFHKDYR